MSQSLRILLGVLATLALCRADNSVTAANPLGPYDITDVTVSGFGAGGNMAVQVHMAFSSVVNGSAIFAGAPYYCAQGNVLTAESLCMKTSETGPDVSALVEQTQRDAADGLIDPVDNLRDDRVYLYAGKLDSVVSPKVGEALFKYYESFALPQALVADYDIESEDVMPTLSSGGDCSTLASPYIGKCDFDGAGTAFKVLYDDLQPRATQAVAGNLLTFKQSSLLPSSLWRLSSLDDTGYIYVPTACQQGAACRLHVSFHSCLQTLADIGSDYASLAGYNEWAESNGVIVAYPYVKKSTVNPVNPNGCWDWWSYTGENYGSKEGVQPQFVYNLIKTLRK